MCRGGRVVVREVRGAVKIRGKGREAERSSCQKARGGGGVPNGAVEGCRMQKDGLREETTE